MPVSEWRQMTMEDAATYDFSTCWTSTHIDDPIHDPDLVAAIFVTNGNLFQMSKLLRRRRNTLKAYLDRNPDIQAVRFECVDCVLDTLEHDVFQSAMSGDRQDRHFVLSTLGKDRGYSTRNQVTGRDDGPIVVERIEWEIVDPPERADETDK